MGEAFVILLHVGHGQDHYDLMLPAGDALATWRVETDPAKLAAGESAPAGRLADHRSAYLTYEGPVSRGRGQVSRVAGGTCRTIARRDDYWEFELASDAVAGAFELARVGPGEDDWRLTRSR